MWKRVCLVTLKVGAPVMLLQNLRAGPGYGLCNGTRMIVLTLGQRVVEVEISSGVNRGNCILISRISIAPSDTELPFTLQFVGIYLPDHVFIHGQLFVAFSRVTDPPALAVCLNNPDGFTRNIVSGSFVTFHVHFVQNHEISVPPDILCEARVGH